ncbi:MBL fold metallo-hydrolase [Mycoplasmatota bacterium]|nr:MBL fold metallo-hydrolase [Mycoplasmatota bacterium]
MKITVLASGSKGNCTYIETEKAKIMVDCGISFRQVRNRLMQHEITLFELDGVFITHEHSDHVSGLPTLLSRIPTNLYISDKAFGKMHVNARNGIPTDLIKYIDGPVQIKDLVITPIRTSHDAAEPYGYMFESNGKKIVHITDTGYLPSAIYKSIEDADAYLFESNYEPELLLESNRPFFLKQRIFGNKGHLSNLDSALILKEVMTERTKHIVFIHLSQECNTPYDAKQVHKVEIPNYDKINIIYSSQDIPTKIIEV